MSGGEVNMHARYYVGGERATLDPRAMKMTDLVPIEGTQVGVDVLFGWEKLHQPIYGTSLATYTLNLTLIFRSYLINSR
jgi:hypothetical protein